jgi:hypothetical protein
MQDARDTPPQRLPGTALRARYVRISSFATLAVLAGTLLGCGGGSGQLSAGSSLLSGNGRPIGTQRLGPAARIARRFAAAYARSVYQRHPVRLPGETAGLSKELAAAATRVPPARRGLHPHALAVRLEPRDGRTLAASVEIGDGHSVPFSVGFLVQKRGPGWRVVSISPPG